MLNILVTAGSTVEKIDNVRSITNSSSGKLGVKIVKEFLSFYKDCNIFFVHGNKVSDIEDSRVNNFTIKNVENLENIIRDILTKNEIHIMVHSMAVSDYTTDYCFDLNKLKQYLLDTKENISEELFDKAINSSKIDNNSKISSLNENPCVLLKQTLKVINLVKKISPYTFLVGFKLLDNSSDEELFDVGFDLLRKNRCNLVVANDIKKIREGNHEALFIYPEKTFDKVVGKDLIAENLVKLIDKRYFVKHPHSIKVDENNDISLDFYEEFKKAGKYLYEKGFLPEVLNHERTEKIGTYGNMSLRFGNTESFYITSRNVHKGKLNKEDLSYIEKVDDIDDLNVYTDVFYHSVLKPSIDTSIHYHLYKNTNFTHIIHIHTNDIFLGVPYIDDQFPCGSSLENDAIIEKLGNNNVIQMKKHGIIVLGYSFDECINIIENLFKSLLIKDEISTDEESLKHIKDVKANFVFNGGVLKNIYYNNSIVGVVWENFKENDLYFGIFSKENCPRGLNIVKKYLNLYSKNYVLCTMPECNIKEFYENKFGFYSTFFSEDGHLEMRNNKR